MVMMSEPLPNGPVNLGFLTIVQENASYLGGYLITNSWGRPLEFRLSTAVQPNRVQNILYGNTLQEYLCADLIGKTLIDKCATPISLLITDSLMALPIRSRLEVPVVASIALDDSAATFLSDERIGRVIDPRKNQPLLYDRRAPGDEERIRQILEKVDPGLDLGEPFGRVREAMAEARKLGATARAA
jgi:hypothetical protein